MKKRVAIIGATGIAGQQFISALQNHEFFEVAELSASEKNAGKTYLNALKDHNGKLNWFCGDLPSKRILEMKLCKSDELDLSKIDLIFSAVESEIAKDLEPFYAERKPVISTASFFRYEDDTPLLIPSINSDHLKLVEVQKSNRNWKGYILPIPNCTTTGFVSTLKPIANNHKIDLAIMTSMQAVSGAGRTSGVLALDIIDNIIPFIPKEEEKVEKETKKILGKLQNDKIIHSDLKVSVTCTRVPVLDGHTEIVNLKLDSDFDLESIKNLFINYRNSDVMDLPSTPKQIFYVHEDNFRPQPRLDREINDGMTVSIGRIRIDSAFKGIKYVLLSHNTKLGAAKGAIWIAELCKKHKHI
ncbi:MAG: aspartate-semialdehyde dehydrogenase [Candidatus Micrarchaeota archaeon]|nr:aspartate-semialdehyde dehydrogenase [Candidatus Micrarchaeota archaeon]